MKIRTPKFDFSQSKPRWAPAWEVALYFNAQSMLFPPLERFLNRVMSMARREITGTDAKSESLRADIGMFIQQEGQHYAIHSGYNEMLVKAGMSELPGFEAKMEAEYRELLKTRSLRFLCSYCEGFEVLGPTFARVYLDGIDDYFADGDPNVIAMFKWHLMEEFEHRTVCFDVYHHLFGDYGARIYGLLYALKHMGTYVTRVQNYMLDHETTGLSEQERAAAKQRMKTAIIRIHRLAVPQIFGVLSPGYTPRRAPTPKNFAAFERQFEQQFSA